MNLSPAIPPASVKPSENNITRLSNDIVRASGDYITYLRPYCKVEWEKPEVVRDLRLLSVPKLSIAAGKSNIKSPLYPRITLDYEGKNYLLTLEELCKLIHSPLFNKMNSMGMIYVLINQFVDAAATLKKIRFVELENVVNSLVVRKDIKTSRTDLTLDSEKVYGAQVLHNIDLMVHALAYELCDDPDELQTAFRKNLRSSCEHYLYYLGAKRFETPLSIELAQTYVADSKLFTGEQAYLQAKLELIVKLVNKIDAQEATVDLIEFMQQATFNTVIGEHKKGVVIRFFENVGVLSTTSTRLLDSLNQDILNFTKHQLRMDAQLHLNPKPMMG